MANHSITYPNQWWTDANAAYDAAKTAFTQMGVSAEAILKVPNPQRPADVQAMVTALHNLVVLWHAAEVQLHAYIAATHRVVSEADAELRA